MFHKGLLVVVCGPSGVGKGTLLDGVLKSDANIKFSVSATTRVPRDGEIDGEDYFFVSEEKFKDMIENDELVEWVKYVDHYYGTPGKFVESSLDAGVDIVLDIEVEGAHNIKNKYPESVLVFVLPPSLDELKRRIENRATEEKETIEKRLDRAKIELSYVKNYEYVVVNDNIDEAIAELRSIIMAEKLRVERNTELINKFD